MTLTEAAYVLVTAICIEPLYTCILFIMIFRTIEKHCETNTLVVVQCVILNLYTSHTCSVSEFSIYNQVALAAAAISATCPLRSTSDLCREEGHLTLAMTTAETVLSSTLPGCQTFNMTMKLNILFEKAVDLYLNVCSDIPIHVYKYRERTITMQAVIMADRAVFKQLNFRSYLKIWGMTAVVITSYLH